MSNFKEFIILILPVFFSILGGFIVRWHNERKSRKFSLTNHTLFNSLINSVREIKSWYIPENRLVFKDALIIKLLIWQVEGKKLAKELQKKKLSSSALDSDITAWANETIGKYEKEWRAAGIPENVIKKINEVHEPKVKELFERIKDTVYNKDMYPLFMNRVVNVFTVLELLLSETKNDFNSIFYREFFNGQFKGVTYKGIPVSDDEFLIYKQKTC